MITYTARAQLRGKTRARESSMAHRARGSAPVDAVSFYLNGQPVVVQGASPLLTLNEWLRAQPQLEGTKVMCAEGGCGCCVVTVARPDPVTKKETSVAVNSVSKFNCTTHWC